MLALWASTLVFVVRILFDRSLGATLGERLTCARRRRWLSKFMVFCLVLIAIMVASEFVMDLLHDPSEKYFLDL